MLGKSEFLKFHKILKIVGEKLDIIFTSDISHFQSVIRY